MGDDCVDSGKDVTIFLFQVSESPLLCLSTQEQGKIMGVGSQDGRLSVIQISDNLSTVTRNDKAALTSVRDVHYLWFIGIRRDIFGLLQLLERETRREKTLEQRTKDSKGKQGFKVAAAAAFHQILPQACLQPTSPKSPTGPSLRNTIIGSLEALQRLQQQDVTASASGNNADDSKEPKQVSGIEPSADMMSTATVQGSQANLSASHAHPESTVDQNLQAAEEAFFETIDQVMIAIFVF